MWRHNSDHQDIRQFHPVGHAGTMKHEADARTALYHRVRLHSATILPVFFVGCIDQVFSMASYPAAPGARDLR